MVLGNRRYAKKKGEEVEKGHSEGGAKLHETLQWCFELGITTVTVFAFSIENFKRNQSEVEALMKLALEHLMDQVPELAKRARVQFLGDLSLLKPELREAMLRTQESSVHIKPYTLNVCFAYTGTEEIMRAMRHTVEAVQKGAIELSDVNAEVLTSFMYSHDVCDPDILVRTSGEVRLSDFQLWQCADSELCFYDVLWPEFSPIHLYATVLKYQYLRYWQAKKSS